MSNSPTVRLPASLVSFAGGKRMIPVSGATVEDAIRDFAGQHPTLAERLFYPSGELRQFVNLFVNEMDIRDLDGMATSLARTDVIAIIPAVAGG